MLIFILFPRCLELKPLMLTRARYNQKRYSFRDNLFPTEIGESILTI